MAWIAACDHCKKELAPATSEQDDPIVTLPGGAFVSLWQPQSFFPQGLIHVHAACLIPWLEPQIERARKIPPGRQG